MIITLVLLLLHYFCTTVYMHVLYIMYICNIIIPVIFSVSCLKFVPKTHLFFSGGKDRLIKQWDADNYQHVITLKVGDSSLTPSLQFSGLKSMLCSEKSRGFALLKTNQLHVYNNTVHFDANPSRYWGEKLKDFWLFSVMATFCDTLPFTYACNSIFEQDRSPLFRPLLLDY